MHLGKIILHTFEMDDKEANGDTAFAYFWFHAN
jgi:hypothetical protein